MTKQYYYILALAIACTLTSCVPQIKYKDLKDSYDALKVENMDLKQVASKHTKEVEVLTIQITERETRISELEKEIESIKSQLANLQSGVENSEGELRKQLEVSIMDREALSEELENKRQELYKREQELKAKNQLLDERVAATDTRESELDALRLEIETKQKELQATKSLAAGQSGDIAQLEKDLAVREQRVKELESIISAQNEQVEALKGKISSALVDFTAGDLTVTQKKGKVYVSLQNKLLFKSGSKNVEPRGIDALGKVGVVLNNNPDIEIIIEGHTDTDGGAKENWDLSVLRATSVVKILEQKGVSPARILASGRGEYFPVADNETTAGKQQNRRIEIILSPKLDQLLDVINR